MLATFKTLIGNQFEAAYCTLEHCRRECPAELWQTPVAKAPFSQVMFHTLFFCDFYLGDSPQDLHEQTYHRDHSDWFGDYEQLQDRMPTSVYTKESIEDYLQHCRTKTVRQLDRETAATLEAMCRFPRRKVTRAELYVYNLRHVYHHAAQLSLRLRLDSEVDVPWVDSGWQLD